MKKILALFLCLPFLFFNTTIAVPSQPPGKNGAVQHNNTLDDALINSLYREANFDENASLNERLIYFSNPFLGKPYTLGPLGEGSQAKFDQHPLYRTDTFDCLTFVETTMALALSNNLDEFQQTLLALRYVNNTPRFVERNHFMSADWNPNNQYKGYIYDVTGLVTNEQGVPIAKTAETIINKPSWYQHFTHENLKRGDKLTGQQRAELLQALHDLSKKVRPQKVATLYLPLTELFDQHGQPKQAVFDQIPSGSIIEVVRPNWNLQEKIGTHLNVSHVGFAIRMNEQLFFREASTVENQVIDIPLATYLHHYLNSPTVGGINVQMIQAR